MRVDLNVSDKDLNTFADACEAVIRNVGYGTKKASAEAGNAILQDSLEQVPRDTETLAKSAFLGVARRTDTKGYRYGAVVGYGEPAYTSAQTSLGAIEWLQAPNNGVNPKTGKQASDYAVDVHEDLDMPHPRGGNAKFLENALRSYGEENFTRVATKYWKDAMKGGTE